MATTSNHNHCYEVRFHGRGGQGAVSAAALLSLAAFENGHNAQAFPRFGSERRGAPVEAYVRMNSAPIRSHNQVYHPDAVVIQDKTLLRSEPVLKGIKENGLVILNSEQPLGKKEQSTANLRWINLPASAISESCLGKPLPNTVLLGAFAACTDWVDLSALEQAIQTLLANKGEKIVTANVDALREGFRVAKLQQEATS